MLTITLGSSQDWGANAQDLDLIADAVKKGQRTHDAQVVKNLEAAVKERRQSGDNSRGSRSSKEVSTEDGEAARWGMAAIKNREDPDYERTNRRPVRMCVISSLVYGFPGLTVPALVCT